MYKKYNYDFKFQSRSESSFLKEALDYASEFIERNNFPCTPCEMLAITMAYHLSLDKLEDENILNRI